MITERKTCQNTIYSRTPGIPPGRVGFLPAETSFLAAEIIIPNIMGVIGHGAATG